MTGTTKRAISNARRKDLLKRAEVLAADLSRFRTPGSNDPVDPSRLAEVGRFLRANRDLALTAQFLDGLSSSFHNKMSRSAPHQLMEIVRRVKPLIPRPTGDADKDRVSVDETLFLLGWAQRLLATAERGTGFESQAGGPRHGR